MSLYPRIPASLKRMKDPAPSVLFPEISTSFARVPLRSLELTNTSLVLRSGSLEVSKRFFQFCWGIKVVATSPSFHNSQFKSNIPFLNTSFTNLTSSLPASLRCRSSTTSHSTTSTASSTTSFPPEQCAISAVTNRSRGVSKATLPLREPFGI